MPPSFYSFAYATSLTGAHAVDVRFAGGLWLVGYSVNPPRVSVTRGHDLLAGQRAAHRAANGRRHADASRRRPAHRH